MNPELPLRPALVWRADRLLGIRVEDAHPEPGLTYQVTELKPGEWSSGVGRVKLRLVVEGLLPLDEAKAACQDHWNRL